MIVKFSFNVGVQVFVLQQGVRLQRPEEQAHQVQPRAAIHLFTVQQKISHQTHPSVTHKNAHRRKGTLFAK